jgi:hypothetical protein
VTAPATTEPEPVTHPDESAVAGAQPDFTSTGVRTARRHAKARGRRNRIAFGLTIALLAAAIPALGFMGVTAILSSRGGRLVDTTVAPDEPGYEAIVEPTPVALVVHTEAGQLVALTVLSLASPEGGGAVLFVPADTLTDPTTQAFGFDRLRGAFDVAGVDGVRGATAGVLNASFTDAIEIDGTRLAALTAPVAPLRLDNPDDLDGEDAAGQAVSFDAGALELPADQVGAYLAMRDGGESDLNRLVRHQLLWEAWIAAVSAAPDPATAVPGEGGTGLGRYLGQLARGSVVYQTLPVDEMEPDVDVEAFAPVESDLPGLVARLIPLPTAASPGSRVRVRLLDGAGSPEAVRAIIGPLVVAGAQIVAIGNADRFTYAATDVRYDSLTPRSQANRMRAALGIGEVSETSFGTDAFDVTIVVGADLVDRTTEQGATTTV